VVPDLAKNMDRAGQEIKSLHRQFQNILPYSFIPQNSLGLRNSLRRFFGVQKYATIYFLRSTFNSFGITDILCSLHTFRHLKLYLKLILKPP